MSQETLLAQAYAAFNARDIDGALALMHPDVEWPNGWEGGWVRGHAGVRDYWTRQWAAIDPSVHPIAYSRPTGHDDIVRVRVRQEVRDLQGAVLDAREVEHVYYFDARGLVRRMEIAGADDSEIAGVVARPPRLFLATIILGIGLDRLLPLSRGPHVAPAAHWIVSAILTVTGLAFMIAAMRGFGRARTPVPTVEPTRALVTTGVHGRSRNPIYLGMFLIYAGIGVAARSTWMLVLLVPLILVMRYGVIAREEAYLERRFGDAYRQYKTRVRRWL